jgi:lysozyme family protein
MHKADFDRAAAFVLDIEKGETTDTGGYTNYGISTKAHPDEDIANMTPERATEIYRRDYWAPLGLEELPHPVALAMLDVAVNTGPRAAVKCMQRAANRLSGGDRLKVDGWLGPITRGAVEAVLGSPGGALALATQIAVARLEVHYRLAGFAKYRPNIRGWAGRCALLCNQLAQDWAANNKE